MTVDSYSSTHSVHVCKPSQHRTQYISYPSGVPLVVQPHFISRNDLAIVELALMHNKNCQIPGCCCHRVKEIIENKGYRYAPYNSPEMGSICSSGSGNNSSRAQRMGRQQSSMDSNSDFGSSSNRRSRPLNWKLLGDHDRIGQQQSSMDSDSDYGSSSDRQSRPLSLLDDEQNRNPNLHPHYHLMTKSYLRRVSVHTPVNYRKSKSLSDLTPITSVPEIVTPATGGTTKPGTPIQSSQPLLQTGLLLHYISLYI